MLISVVTPSFNRAHTLQRTFDSLVAQTVLPHEWVIVDDGSTDGTRERVEEWRQSAPFPVQYVWQENAGKPSAHNRGVSLASGELVTILDSDDWCEPAAIARFSDLWLEIPPAERDRFTGVSVHRADSRGQLIGRLFPESPIDSTLAEMWERGWLIGDKWGFHRREVLLKYPFPVFEGEKFVPEGVVWNRIGRAYKMRFVNEVLGRTEYRQDGLSYGRWQNMMRSPRGFQLYYSEMAHDAQGFAARCYGCANAVRFALHAVRVSGAMPTVDIRGLVGAVGFVTGCGLWSVDRLRNLVFGDGIRRPS